MIGECYQWLPLRAGHTSVMDGDMTAFATSRGDQDVLQGGMSLQAVNIIYNRGREMLWVMVYDRIYNPFLLSLLCYSPL